MTSLPTILYAVPQHDPLQPGIGADAELPPGQARWQVEESSIPVGPESGTASSTDDEPSDKWHVTGGREISTFRQPERDRDHSQWMIREGEVSDPPDGYAASLTAE